MRHDIKIKGCYLIHILEGKKTFEVRKNDRDYQVGDTIYFLPLQDESYNVYAVRSPLPEFEIVYTTSFGCQDDFIVLGIKELTPNR